MRNFYQITMETKICSKCKESKYLCGFQKNKYSKDGHRSECSECSKKNNKLKSKDVLNEYHRNYREKNRTKLNENQRQYYLNNRDKELLRNRLHKEKKLTKNSLLKKIKSTESWQKKNKELFYTKRKEKYKNNIIFKLSQTVRNRLNLFLKITKHDKNYKTFNIIGCSPKFLKEHLETKFIDGMSWDNRSEWHIDHIIPLSSAKTEEELYGLCHYTNLQPLWAEDNLKKSNKIL